MGVALLGVALLLGACAPTPAHDATVVSRLDDMLVDESAVNAIMGPPPLTATHTYRALEQWPAGYSYSPADCLAVSGNAMASVYQGTRSGEMRGTLFTNDQTGTEVDEAVVAFDTAAHARDFVASTVCSGQRCSDEADHHVTAVRPGRSPSTPHAVGADRSRTAVAVVQRLGHYACEPLTPSSMCGSPRGTRRPVVRVVNAIVDHGRI
jgi:hypothetical protein